MEIIVVDNASTDGSPESVKSRFPHVRLFCNDSNLGFAKANNLGISASTGRYACLVNSDVKVLKDCITRLVDYCESHTDVGMVGPHVTGRDDRLQPSCRTFPTLQSSLYRALALDTLFPRSRVFASHAMTWWDYNDTREVDVLSGCFWFIRQSALKIVGGLDTRFFMYGEDIDFCRRFHQAGWKVVFNPEAAIIHYGGASSSNAPARFAVEMQRAFLQYFLKHDGRLKTCIHFVLALFLHLGRFFGSFVPWILLPARRPVLLERIHSSGACAKWLVKTFVMGGLFGRGIAREQT
jgi:GT2 family glycosyltransferase